MKPPASSNLGVLGLVLGAALLAAAVTLAITTQKPLVAGAILAALVVPGAAVLSGNPRIFCLWGLILTAPIELSKYFISYPHMGGEYALRIELSDPFLAVLLIYWIRDLTRMRVPRLSLPRPTVYWSLLLLMALGTVILGPWRTAAGMEVVRMTKILLMVMMLSNELRRPRQIQHVALALVVGILVQSGFGMLQIVTGSDLGLERMAESGVVSEALGGTEAQRVGALMGHPNILSCYFAMVIPLAVSLLFTRATPLLKLLIGTTVGLGLIVLVATLSRNGWLSFAVALLVVLVLTGLHTTMVRRHRILRWGVIAGLAVAVLVFSPALLKRLTESDPTNLAVRWELNGVAFDMALDRPVFGFGKNSLAFERSTNRRFQIPVIDAGSTSEDISPIHNIYMQQWAEQGTVGLILFLLMLISIARIGLRNGSVLGDSPLFAVNAGALAGTIAMMIHGLGDWAFWWNGIMRVFWILASLLFALKYIAWRAVPAPHVAASTETPTSRLHRA